MEQINSLSDFHRLLHLPKPLHPLVSVVLISELHIKNNEVWKQFSTDFYTISLKNHIQSKVKYGQQYYDFDTGTMTFIAPKQVQSVETDNSIDYTESIGTGYVLMFHPDFLAKHPLAKNISDYGFFSYSLNESLHLSDPEEKYIVEIFQKIQIEYQHIDRHTQVVILSLIDLLLKLSNRFYERQFITRKAVNNDLLSKIEHLIDTYFEQEKVINEGLPTVTYLAAQLNVSARYLSDMLRSCTGQNTQQIIHNKLIEIAKVELSTNNLSVSEIAYRLGFEHPQSFSKFFKNKTNESPLKFRQSFN